MTRKSNSRKARDHKTFVSDRRVETAAYAFFRSKWGNLTDEQIKLRVSALSVEERQKLSDEIIGGTIAKTIVEGRIS